MEICEEHLKSKELLCLEKTCMRAICNKCLKKHNHNGQNFISIDELTEESQQKHQNRFEQITEFKNSLNKELTEKTNFLSNFDKNNQIFAENVENQLKEFISHISKMLEMRRKSQESSKKMLEIWVMDAGKAVGTLNRHLDELAQEIKKNSEFLEKRDFAYIYEKYLEVKKDPISEFKPLLKEMESKFLFKELDNAEKGAQKFMVDEFMSFYKLDQWKNQEDCETQEKIAKIEARKKEFIELDKKLEDLKQQIKSETSKLIEIQQVYLRNPVVNFKNLENTININYENNKNWVKNLARFFFEPSIKKGFNTSFAGLDFTENGMICSCYSDKWRYCLSENIIESNSNAEIELSFIKNGGCSFATFGLIESFPFDTSSNNKCLSDLGKELFECSDRGSFSSNLKGMMRQIDYSTKINLAIQKKELIITSNDGIINLKGKLTKDKYYLGVSLYGSAFFQILKFTTTSVEQEKLKTIDNLLI